MAPSGVLFLCNELIMSQAYIPFFLVIERPKDSIQTTNKLPETEPTVPIEYRDEVEISRQKFDSGNDHHKQQNKVDIFR